MRIMYDAVSPGNIPVDAQIVAGYINGRYAWHQSDWDRFPHSLKVAIAVSADADAKCLDVETYDATPAQAPGWARRQRARGETHPWVYMNESTWPEVRRQFAIQGEPDPVWWVAAYPGSVGQALYPGAHAHQYMDDGGKDWSLVADFVPGLDVTPAPAPTPPKPPQEDDMAPAVAVTADGTQYYFWKGTDGNLWQGIIGADGAKSAPIKLGFGPMGGAPTAGVDHAGATFAAWKGMDGDVWRAWWNAAAAPPAWTAAAVGSGWGPLG